MKERTICDACLQPGHTGLNYFWKRIVKPKFFSGIRLSSDILDGHSRSSSYGRHLGVCHDYGARVEKNDESTMPLVWLASRIPTDLREPNLNFSSDPTLEQIQFFEQEFWANRSNIYRFHYWLKAAGLSRGNLAKLLLYFWVSIFPWNLHHLSSVVTWEECVLCVLKNGKAFICNVRSETRDNF